MPNGQLFPENAQGYVEFDLFEDSDEIPDDKTTVRQKDHVDIPRLPPPPPPKPPRPKKSVPGNHPSIQAFLAGNFVSILA